MDFDVAPPDGVRIAEIDARNGQPCVPPREPRRDCYCGFGHVIEANAGMAIRQKERSVPITRCLEYQLQLGSLLTYESPTEVGTLNTV